MRPLEDARAEVLETVFPLGSETVPLAEAEGRILAEDVRAPTDVPPFPNSAMDGFAVIASDVASPPVRLRVVEDVPAGSVATRTVTSGMANKIMTGAPMPAGADAVVKVEVTRQPDPETVVILEAVAPGTAVRPAGGDMPAGSLVLGAGAALGPVELGLLATAGVGSPRVGRRPRVALMATGDELRPAETVALEPGQIRDSNRPLLRGLIHQAGGEVIDLGIVGDEEAALTNALNRAAEESDAIVTSGGVSMGEYDLIKRVLSARGTVDFWQVAMQPAKPFAFGHIESVPLFGLPGNPVSVMVAFEQFARPALLKMQDATRLFRPRIVVPMGEAIDTDPEKVVFVRVALHREGHGLTARSSGGQSSNVLSALGAADGLAVVPVGTGRVDEGSLVEVELFRHPSAEFGR